MPHYDHLIVGGGMTADSAIKAIRERRPDDSIGLVSADGDPPYNRPPLTKGLWKGDAEESVWRKTQEKGATLHLGRRATALDTASKTVTDDSGESYTYGKLLLATGGRVRELPNAPEGVIYYRSFADYRGLREQVKPGVTVAVIGGGFIGSELAAGLAMNNAKVTMVFPEDGIGARVYPAGLSAHLNDYYREHGVEVLDRESMKPIERTADGYRLTMESGKSVDAAIVVAGIGIVPDTQLAEQAGIKVDNGIVVDEQLQTSAPDIYAAGDVANFMNPALGKRLRVEHEDNANSMGAMAGANMAGDSQRYDYLPMFYSDLFDLGYEAVGEMDARHEMFEDWKKPFEEGVVYYLDGGRVRGVLLWNTWDQVDNARALIAEPGPFTAEQLKGRLPK
jgi:NADPH-dependent 2,4-dienoyl-CoA reductase/sulfur reductase-like enzyme